MAVERKPILPVGFYWVVVFEADRPQWAAWLSANRGKVLVRGTEQLDGSSTFDNFFGDEHSVGDWVKFEVLQPPTKWEGPGFPTIIPPGKKVEGRSDVEQAPVIEGPSLPGLPELGSFARGAAPWIVVGIVALYAVRRLIK